jgi:hypothetical protein
VQRHVFFALSTSPLLSGAETLRSASRLGFRKPSFTSLRSAASAPPTPAGPRAVLFRIPLPTPVHPGEELPPSFNHTRDVLSGARARGAVERAEVVFRVLARWESDGSPGAACGGVKLNHVGSTRS